VGPRIDLSVDYVSTRSVTEASDGAAALKVNSCSDTFVSLQPAIELKDEIPTANGVTVRPTAVIVLTHYLTNAGPSVTSFLNFDDMPPGTVRSEANLGRTFLDVSAGLKFAVG